MHLISCHSDCGGPSHGNRDLKTKTKKTVALNEKEACLFTLFAWIPFFDWFPVNVDCGHSASDFTLQFRISQILERSNLFIWYLQKEPIMSSVLLRDTGPHRPTIPFGSASRDSVALEEKEAMETCYSTCFQPKTAVVVDGSTGLALDTLEDCISPDPNVHCLGHCQARQLIVLRDMSEWEPGCTWLCFT